MQNDLISKKTRNEFREYFVSVVLREIEMEFDSADVPFSENYEPPVSGERRTMVEKYYHSVDWTNWKDVRKILTVYENTLSYIEDQEESENSEWYEKKFKELRKWLEKDGYNYINGNIQLQSGQANLEEITTTVQEFNLPELDRQISRMKSAIEEDPGLAIGTAKELVETTCKTILDQRGITFGDGEELSKLVKKTRKCLGLIPESISSSAKGSDIIRRLLSNLGTISQGLNELRNLYGTGHGKLAKSIGLSPRHARLAVGAAATLAVFLFETHNERNI